MLTIADLDEMSIESQARIRELEEEFQRSFYEPIIVMQMVGQFLQMSDEEREQVKQIDPEAYEKAMRYLRGMGL